MKRCGDCKHYRVDPAWKTAGICNWPMPPYVAEALCRANMRAMIVGQSSGEHCPVWQAQPSDIPNAQSSGDNYSHD